MKDEVTQGGPLGEEVLAAARGAFTALIAEVPPYWDGATAAVAPRLEELERRLDRRVLTAAIVGEDVARRSELVNELAGAPILNPTREEPPGLVVVLRRGGPDYRARFADQSQEDFAGRVPDQSAALHDELAAVDRPATSAAQTLADLASELLKVTVALADAERRVAEWDERLEEARRAARLADDKLAAARRDRDGERGRLEARRRGLPIWFRDPGPARTVWLRFLQILFALFWRDARRVRLLTAAHVETAEARVAEAEAAAASAAAVQRDVQSQRDVFAAPIPEGRRREAELSEELAGARTRFAALEAERVRLRAAIVRHGEERRGAFHTAVRTLTDGRARGYDVAELEVLLPDLPEEVVLLDVPAGGSAEERERVWRLVQHEADGCLLAWEPAAGPVTRVLARQALATLPHVHVVPALGGDAGLAREAAVRALGGAPSLRAVDREALAAELPGLLRRERFHLAGHLALGALRAAAAALTDQAGAAARGWAGRLERLEGARIGDAQAYAAGQLVRVRGLVTARAQLIVRHAVDHVAWQLNQLRERCERRLTSCRTLDELRAIATWIAEQAPDALRTVCHDLQVHVYGTIAGGVRDLAPAALADLEACAVRIEESLLGGPAGRVTDAARARARALTQRSLSLRQSLGNLAIEAPPTDVATPPSFASVLGEAAVGAMLDRLLGWRAALFGSVDSHRQELTAHLAGQIESAHAVATAELLEAEPGITRALRHGLGQLLERAVADVDLALDELIAAEREATERERGELEPLEDLRRAIAARIDHLLALLAALEPDEGATSGPRWKSARGWAGGAHSRRAG